MKHLFCGIVFVFLFTNISLYSQSPKCYPTHWWVGMKNPKLQIMVHGDKIADHFSMIKMSPAGVKLATGVRLMQINRVENPNYIFLDLVIDATAKPGKISFPFLRDIELKYELKPRRNGNGKEFAKGITSADFIYLLMPDRFANGDTSNDRFMNMRDTLVDRKNSLLRHGGDIKGITDHLDYFKELGVTTLWLTPVMENDMPPEKEPAGLLSGYHGYWITDHYEVDKRFGGRQAYIDMITAAHNKGMKVIQDAVYNHVGEYHWFVLDPPMKDWINTWPKYQGTNHREEVFIDPYASAIDKKIMIDGWFVPHLPDLNLANPFLANYIIQNTIWATEEFGIDGWRVDTYKYNDEKFLVKINNALSAEYPAITGFGEVTSNTVVASAFFAKNNIITPFRQNILGVTDFPLSAAMIAGMNENFGWTNGVNKLYMTLAQDLLYKDPSNNCIFLDNHDMDRVLSVVGDDYTKLKLGLTWLLTMRGIPQLYYGTEILMKNFKNPSDGMVRLDFPGGWPDDKVNKFSMQGRIAKENNAFNFIKKLADFRRSSSALAKGNTMQYIPVDGVYVYFRYDKNETVMVITNSSDKTASIKVDRFTERLNGFSKMKNVITEEVSDVKDFSMDAKTAGVYLLLK